MSSGNSKPERINCYKCRYFAVSWDPKHPKACTFHEFKTAKLPSAFVLETSGYPCFAFEPKE